MISHLHGRLARKNEASSSIEINPVPAEGNSPNSRWWQSKVGCSAESSRDTVDRLRTFTGRRIR